jgi:3-oxoacyl-[acyl-carrier-protein] synthase-3
MIEAGFVRAGLIGSAETAQQIVELMMDRLLREPSMDRFKSTLATLTGGSGAAAVLLAHRDLAPRAPRLIGAAVRAAPQFHTLCRWGPDSGQPASMPMTMETHAIGVLENGVALGVETWRDLQQILPKRDNASSTPVDRTVCHQVGAANREAILAAIGVAPENDFVTYDRLGNIGTVSLPLTAAIAAETGFLQRRQRVGLLGIGSGLNCLMLGVDW